METNPNFDLDQLPDDYYDELKRNGWLSEHTTIIYVSVDEYETATTVLKDKHDIVILRQFRLGKGVAFSVDIQTKFSEL